MSKEIYNSKEEEWQPIPGFDGYEVSDCGRIRSLKPINQHKPSLKPRILKLKKHRKSGYWYCGLVRNGIQKLYTVHSLVALTFWGPRPKGYDINHCSGNKDDNSMWNLEYATRSQNVKHAFATGLKVAVTSQECNLAKLSVKSVREIRALYSSGHSQSKIASKFQVSQPTVWNIVNNKTWRNV